MNKAKKQKRLSWLAFVTAVGLMIAGIYLAVLVVSPMLHGGFSDDATRDIVASYQVENKMDAVIIPKIGISVPFYTGDESVLEKGAWHRHPERGDPTKGGNFVLSGHRFELGLTPQQTRARSPFYHIDKLAVGDKILVLYKEKEYPYTVSRTYSVEPHEVSIEAPSDIPKLTLYTCTLGGSADGRVVIEALPDAN